MGNTASKPRLYTYARFPWFILLLPVSFVLHGYVKYPDFVSTQTIIKLIAQYFAIILIVSLPIYLYLREWNKSLLVAVAIMAVNFYGGVFHDFLLRQAGASWYTRQVILGLLLGFLFLIWIYRLKKMTARLSAKTIVFLNTLLLIFIGIDAAGWKSPNSRQREQTIRLPALPPSAKRPDIFLIVLDEYAGQTSLRKGMGFDNAAFLQSLRTRGFFVADSSQANYNATHYAMASLLSLDYIRPGKEGLRLTADIDIAFSAIYRNPLTAFLNQQGYRILNNSWFRIAGSTSMNNPAYGPAEESFIDAQTLWKRFRRNGLLALLRKLKWNSLQESLLMGDKSYNDHVLANIEKAIQDHQTEPKFVYSHLSMPHFPYYFNSNGQLHSIDTLSRLSAGNQQAYLEYLKYTNGIVLDRIDLILNQSKRPFYILLLSDHGYREMEGIGFGRSAYSNLFAIYSSSMPVASFPASISNVNVFRIFLNECYQLQLPLLADSTFRLNF